MPEALKPPWITRAAEASGFGNALSRRQFLLLSATAVGSLAALNSRWALGSDPPVIILDQALGMLLSDPSRCVGCLRCELACTEFNDGRAQPSLAHIKVGRNLDFGPDGPSSGSPRRGSWGDGLFVAETCRQCPHPVPCATACPEDAIKADPETGARIIDAGACIGCRLCLRACPWNMISFDDQALKASKCFLCRGHPKCVEACPAGALRYVPWRDLTREAPLRAATLTVIPPQKVKGCLECHVSQ